MSEFSPYEDTQAVHSVMSEWLLGNRRLHLPAGHPQEQAWAEPDAMRDFLRIAAQMEAIHFVTESYEKQQQAFYAISPEFIGPVLSACQPNDPVYAQYRHMSLLLERAQQCHYQPVIEDILRGYFCVENDVNGGRHKLNANIALNILPTTPAIGTDYPKAYGTAKAIELATSLQLPSVRFRRDAICVVSGGDGSIHHPTALSTFNMAKRAVERHEPLPLLFVIADNGVAISERSPISAVQQLAHWGLPLFSADAKASEQVYDQAYAAQAFVRARRQPAILVVKTYRLFGHSANRRNENYTPEELRQLYQHPPILYLMQRGVDLGYWDRDYCNSVFTEEKTSVMQLAQSIQQEPILTDANRIAAPLFAKKSIKPCPIRLNPSLMNMRQMLTYHYETLLANDTSCLFYGQDISPGHYGVGMGLRQKFPKQVYGFPIDEIALVGSANGLIWNHLLPIVEISYKAYFMEGGWQQYAEHFLQRFLSQSLPPNGMILRMPALGLVKGGPTHTENCFPERLIPGATIFCPGTPYSAALCVNAAYKMAKFAAQSVIINEPTYQYFQACDQFPGDSRAIFVQPAAVDFGEGDSLVYGFDAAQAVQVEVLNSTNASRLTDNMVVLTYGNGVQMALQAIFNLSQTLSVKAVVIEVPSLTLSPRLLSALESVAKVLMVDECRPLGSPSETWSRVLAAQGLLSERVGLVQSFATFNPSGPAQRRVYISVEQIETSLTGLS